MSHLRLVSVNKEIDKREKVLRVLRALRELLEEELRIRKENKPTQRLV